MTTWYPITDDQPPPLEDVLVSTLMRDEVQPVVFQAWRSNADPSRFLLTGSDDPVPGRVYSFATEPEPADAARFLGEQANASMTSKSTDVMYERAESSERTVMG